MCISRAIFVPIVLVCAWGQGADMQEALAALQRGDFPAAEVKLRAELRMRPDDAETLSLLAFALDGQKKLPEAAPLHRRALAVAPGSGAVLGRFGNHLLIAGDEKEAREVYQRAVAADATDGYANLQLAELLLRLKDATRAKEALACLDRLSAHQQGVPRVAALRVMALELSGHHAEAEMAFGRLAAATSSDASLSGSLGWTLAEAGQYERAEILLTQALAGDPSNFRVIYNLGVVALYTRHYERARDVLESAVRQQPESVDALYSLAFAYSVLKQPEPALRALAQAAKLAPRRADVQRLIAVTTADLHAYEDSAAAWDRYLALAPNDDTARRERGFARIHLRQFETGMVDLEWYIARHPGDPVGHYELGLAQSTSDPTKGVASLDKALELKPDFVAARSARGALNYLQGKPEAAVADLESAAASQPSNGMILDRLGQAYRALDRLPDAIRVLRRAAKLAPGESTILLHLGSVLAEAGQTAEADVLMGRYRQMRPAQAPRGLMSYLSLTPEQQSADYRTRVEKAVRDNPGDASAQVHYLKLSLEENQMEQAAAAARAIVAAKAGAAVLADAGRALLEARQYAPAKELLEKAAAADPSAGLELDRAIATFRVMGAEGGLRLLGRVSAARRNADYQLARAQMLDALGKGEEAIVAVQQALAASPKRGDLYWQAAVLLNRGGRGAEAIELLDRAEKTLPQDVQIPLVRITLLERAGQTEAAEQLLDKVQRRWPEVAAVWVARGVIYAAHRRVDEARKALETALAMGARSPEVRALAGRVTDTPDPRELFQTKPPQDW